MQEFWNQRYSEEEYAYGTRANSWFRHHLRGRTPGRILLPGEGEGRNAVHAARAGWDVTAWDYSEAGRDKALALAAAHGVRINYDVVDLSTAVPAAGRFDAVALVFVHLPPEQRRRLHTLCANALAPGGVLILEAFSQQQLRYESGGPRSEDLLYTLSDLREDVRDLRIVRAERRLRQLREGPYHAGTASVLRLLALRD